MVRVVIIGAGVGGLAAALRLAAQGLDVTVIEAAGAPGGKMRVATAGDARIDAGPTVLTMRWVFDNLARDAGFSLNDRLTLQPLETLARHAWSGGARLDLFSDVERNADAIGDFAGAREAEGYRRFSRRAAAIYATLKESFIGASRPSVSELVRRVGVAHLGDLARISPFTSLWGELGGYFGDPRLRQLFGRYATYCGSSPFAAPATLMLVAHVEREGVWSIEGGMHRLAVALADMATSCGATFCYGRRVARVSVQGGHVAGVELADGERLAADVVVMNGDVEALAAGLLGPDVADAVDAAPRNARSLSAITWAFKAQTQGFPLLRHNVFFSPDYRREFEDICSKNRLPQAPTVYVCAQDRVGSDDAKAGPSDGERLFCLVNAPANADPLKPADIRSCEAAAFQHLERCGLQGLHRAGPGEMTTPADFARLFPGSGGALYGRASHGWMASFARPGSRTRISGLYLAGGGTHPGPGVPMAALSGRQAALAVMMDLASTGRWRRAATPGGMSTRSATTGDTDSRSSPSSAASSRPITPGPADRIPSTIAR
jgi:1-hydroxycarotenoid 3,4-desaturase